MRIVAFVDHEIGYQAALHLIDLARSGCIELAAIVTPRRTGQEWWRGCAELCAATSVTHYIYETAKSDTLMALDADWNMLLSWKYVLDAALLDAPRFGTINLHYSLLPKYRGVYPVNWALIEGDEETGITFHLVTEEIDSGPIIAQSSLYIQPDDTARSLQLRLDRLALETMRDLIPALVDGRVSIKTAEPQNEALASYRSRKDFNEIRRVDPHEQKSGLEWVNLLRGLSFLQDAPNCIMASGNGNKDIHLHLTVKPSE